MTEARVPVTDDALVEKVARAIADDVYSNFEPEQREAGDHEIWLTAARAAIAIAYPAGVAAGREEAAKVADASSTPPEGSDAYWMAYTAASFDIATAIRQRGE